MPYIHGSQAYSVRATRVVTGLVLSAQPQALALCVLFRESIRNDKLALMNSIIIIQKQLYMQNTKYNMIIMKGIIMIWSVLWTVQLCLGWTTDIGVAQISENYKTMQHHSWSHQAKNEISTARSLHALFIIIMYNYSQWNLYLIIRHSSPSPKY